MLDKNLLFPFNKISAGSRVIIYGADITGWCFYEQIKSLSFCDVLCFIDKNLQTSPYEIPVLQPNQIYKIKNYNYILIASSNEKTIQLILDYLVRAMKISTRKIISQGYTYILKNKGIHGKGEWLCDKLSTNKIFHYSKGENRKILLEEILDFDVGIDILKDVFVHEKDVKRKLIQGMLLCLHSQSSHYFFKEYVNAIDMLFDENPEWCYALVIDLTFIEIFHPEYIYNDFYLDKRKLLTKLGDEFFPEKLSKASYNDNNKKIAIFSIFSFSSA
jgi:hypothetical protein